MKSLHGLPDDQNKRKEGGNERNLGTYCRHVEKVMGEREANWTVIAVFILHKAIVNFLSCTYEEKKRENEREEKVQVRRSALAPVLVQGRANHLQSS